MEDDIQRPVQCIFDGPVAPARRARSVWHRRGRLLMKKRRAGWWPLNSRVSSSMAMPAQTGPVRQLLQPVDLPTDHAAACLHAPVACIALGGCLMALEWVLAASDSRNSRTSSCSRLVALEGQHVVRTLVLNLLCDVALAAHRIHRDGVPGHIHQIEQGRDGRDPLDLAPTLCCPSTRRESAPYALTMWMGQVIIRPTAAHRLAIDGDDPRGQRGQRGHPGDETGAKLLGSMAAHTRAKVFFARECPPQTG